MSQEERTKLKGLLGLHAYGILWIDNPETLALRNQVSMRLNPVMLGAYSRGAIEFNRMATSFKNRFPPDVCKHIDSLDVPELKSFCSNMPRPTWAMDDA